MSNLIAAEAALANAAIELEVCEKLLEQATEAFESAKFIVQSLPYVPTTNAQYEREWRIAQAAEEAYTAAENAYNVAKNSYNTAAKNYSDAWGTHTY